MYGVNIIVKSAALATMVLYRMSAFPWWLVSSECATGRVPWKFLPNNIIIHMLRPALYDRLYYNIISTIPLQLCFFFLRESTREIFGYACMYTLI